MRGGGGCVFMAGRGQGTANQSVPHGENIKRAGKHISLSSSELRPCLEQSVNEQKTENIVVE